ncbi:TPA: hypothetical protein DEO28_00045 [Candidatus Dependentiae bacterium]|nr:MAG: NUDIX hydrolase [candidate division TM6 bacterium GW2011_GWE2_31_21]KKP53988.1 MAG: NUDIX hydrolase [candidate division TM6 bacterium GW2011_GWF2_33_332]HBS48431.1 hypothetical protein [Candidatus Dependentiae bacterium]HBZ72895.1 hypothetical protein [Candidatus Dependentiae bacterium]
MQSCKIQKSKNPKIILNSVEEEILVVRREFLFPYGVIDGLQFVDVAEYEKLILSKGIFLKRSLVEEDTNYKQIIPYLVFSYKDKFFLMQRKSSASESRLKNKYSLGIGGHIRKEDLVNGDITSWATREFSEEIYYGGSFNIKPIGLLNDESDAVGSVHTGFIFLLEGDSSRIDVRSELKQGNLYSIPELLRFYTKMESWSKIVFDYLKKI